MHVGLKRKIGASLLVGAAVVLGSATTALAASGADPDTYGTGHVVIPSASPYITHAYVDTCSGGSPVLISRGRATVDTSVAYGPDSVTGIGPNSYAHTKKTGTYTNAEWRCLAITRG